MDHMEDMRCLKMARAAYRNDYGLFTALGGTADDWNLPGMKVMQERGAAK